MMNTTACKPPPVRRCPLCGAKHRLTDYSAFCTDCKVSMHWTLTDEDFAQAQARLSAPPVPDGSSVVAHLSARCQYCDRTEHVFGPRGDLPFSPLRGAGWRSGLEGGCAVWTCPACRRFVDLLCENVTSPGAVSGPRTP
jgi:hypothetical protein